MKMDDIDTEMEKLKELGIIRPLEEEVAKVNLESQKLCDKLLRTINEFFTESIRFDIMQVALANLNISFLWGVSNGSEELAKMHLRWLFEMTEEGISEISSQDQSQMETTQ